jgi:hypothetical protein
MFFLLFCEYQMKLEVTFEGEFFLYHYDIWAEESNKNLRTMRDQFIIVIYWAFTTITSVGLGDFVPRSNSERVFTIFIILIGVSVKSYIMGKFVDILHSYKAMHADIDDGENLTLFLNTLRRFNQDKALNTKWRDRVESYFAYRWSQDKMLKLDTCQNIMQKLPIENQD